MTSIDTLATTHGMLRLSPAPARVTAIASLDTPLGAVLLARTALGLSGLWFDGQKDHPGTIDAPLRPEDDLLAQAAGEVQRYWTHPHTRFTVPLDLHGTPFQCAVWAALLDVHAGQTRSYGALATRVGRPRAVRAVGAAVGRNPVSVIVPCHRILGRDGSLTGYAGGLDRKQHLLRLEGALLT